MSQEGKGGQHPPITPEKIKLLAVPANYGGC